jgi:hypothetical protein
MCVRGGGALISSIRHKPLQIRQADHPRDISARQVAYLHLTSHPGLRANESASRPRSDPKTNLH